MIQSMPMPASKTCWHCVPPLILLTVIVVGKLVSQVERCGTIDLEPPPLPPLCLPALLARAFRATGS